MAPFSTNLPAPPSTPSQAPSQTPPPTPPRTPDASHAAPEVGILRLDESRTHVSLRGMLDVGGTQAIEQLFTTVVTSRRLSTLVEVQHVSFLSSYAMCMLVMASRAIRLRGRLLVLVAPTAEIEAVLRATRLHLLMPIASTAEEAMELIARHESGRQSATPGRVLD